MDKQIIYEDEAITLLNKPAGVIVNRADTTRHEVTVQDWFEQKLRVELFDSAQGKNGELRDDDTDFYKRGGVVHRLDKETSGMLILAKNPEAFVALQQQFKERTVKKVYQAFAHGKIKPEEGEIQAPVGRLPWNRTRFGILPGGRESITLYKAIAYYRDPKTKEILTYVELYPQSGRTHQIRVHLKYINHPIFADFLYAGRKTSRNDRKVLGRVFLHAAKISFLHPVSHKEISFEAELPQALSECLSKFEPLSVIASD